MQLGSWDASFHLEPGCWPKDSHCSWMLTTTDVKYIHADEYQTWAGPPEDLSPWRTLAKQEDG